MRTALVLLFSSTVSLLAQDPTAPTTPAAAAAVLPEAGTLGATELVDKAIAKMQAVGRGTWKTTEAQDNALLRGAGMPFGNDDTEVEGGWHQDLVWGDFDGDRYVRSGGRMVAKVGDEWKLRGSKLASGKPAPFTLDPALLFTVLRELPAEARKVVHVEAGEVAGKKVAILSLTIEGDPATEFADSGAVPGVGGRGGLVMFGGMGGGMEMPQPDYSVNLALFVNPDNGDVLRFAAKVFEKNPMFGNVQIRMGGPGGGAVEEEETDEEKDEKETKQDDEVATDQPTWKKGLLVKKPQKDESVMTFRADFKNLGLGEVPALDDKAKLLLRVR